MYQSPQGRQCQPSGLDELGEVIAKFAHLTGTTSFKLDDAARNEIKQFVEAGGTLVIDAAGGSGKFYIQNVKPGISTTDQREQGCRQAIEATGGAGTLVGVDYNDDSAANSAQQTTAVLQRTPDLTGIFGANLFSVSPAVPRIGSLALL